MAEQKDPRRQRRGRRRPDAEAPAEADDRNVVRSGGIAPDAASAEDVTRDTYGFTETDPDAESADERIAETDRAAAAAGIPGAAPQSENEPTPADLDRIGEDEGEPTPD